MKHEHHSSSLSIQHPVHVRLYSRDKSQLYRLEKADSAIREKCFETHFHAYVKVVQWYADSFATIKSTIPVFSKTDEQPDYQTVRV